MAENNNDNDDFIGKLKKMKEDMKSKSIIGETLEKIDSLEKENAELKEELSKNKQSLEDIQKEKNKLEDNVNTLTNQTTELSKKQSSLETEIKKLSDNNKSLNNKLNTLTKEKEELNAKLKKVSESTGTSAAMSDQGSDVYKKLVDDLQSELSKRKTQIVEFKTKVNELETEIKNLKEENGTLKIDVLNDTSADLKNNLTPLPQPGQVVNKPLMDDLSSELSKKKSQVLELTNKIKILTHDNKVLNEQLDDLKSKIAKEGIPEVSKPVKLTKTVESNQASSKTLNILVQDLQSDLNKYKKITQELKEQNQKLKKKLEVGGIADDSDEIKQLKREIDALKGKITDLENVDIQETKTVVEESASENKIKDLEKTIQNQENIIKELKAVKPVEASTSDTLPVSGLIEDLQGNINKLKLALKEKNKIIEELKKSKDNVLVR